MTEAIFSTWASFTSWFTPAVLFCLLNLTIGTIYISSNFLSHRKNPPHDIHSHSDEDPHNPSRLARSPSLVGRVFSLYRSDSLDPPQQPETHSQTRLARAPSILDRVKSINRFSGFSPYRSDSLDISHTETHRPEPVQTRPEPVQKQLARPPSFLERVKSFNFSLYGYDHPDPNHPSKKDPSPDADYDHHVVRSKSDTTGAGAGEEHVTMRKSASERRLEEEGVEEEERRRPATVRESKGTAAARIFGEEEEGGGVDAKADDFIHRFKQQLKLQRLDSLMRYREMITRGSSR